MNTTLHTLTSFFLHLDQSLAALAASLGAWTYALLFGIFFCETGILVAAFLPGDSLLFAAGTLAALAPDSLNIHLLFFLLLLASTAGNTVNYLFGKWVGPQLFRHGSSRLFSQAHLAKTHAFCERYGSMGIVLARFLPIIRTFAPFVAGVGYMRYRQFLLFNLTGGFFWVGGILYASYFFGTLPFVREHFPAVTCCIILVSLLPVMTVALRKISKRTLS